MKGLFLRILVHVVGCLAFLALPYVFAPDSFSFLVNRFENLHEQRNLYSSLFIIGYFYLSYYVLIPKFFFPQKYLLFSSCTAICFFLIAFVFTSRDRPEAFPGKPFRTEKLPPPPPAPDVSHQPPPDRLSMEKPVMVFDLTQKFFLFLLAFFLSISLRINARWRAAEQDKLNTELSYLKAQINPHFLFNTLNSIYSLAIEQSEATADAIVQLSAFMRYVTGEAQQDTVPLYKELEYIGHYVALQKIRLDDTATIDFSVKGSPQNLIISPLILISFIENAFKYGVSPEKKSLITIHLVISNQQLLLMVTNQKVRIFQDEEHSTGVGITNTKSRLELIYPDRHTLSIQETPATFRVDLTIHLA
ncbi:MAG: sensor histidine kinase [Siphonobacter sp.]